MGFDFAGRVALVTGGGTGIGLASARRFAAAGAAVTLSGRRGGPLAAAVEKLQGAGATALAVPGGVSLPADCERMVTATLEAFGSLDTLVHNAGVVAGGPVEAHPEEAVHSVFDVDLKGPVFLTQAAVGELRRGGRERATTILNISSSVTISPVPNYSIYSAAKAGLEMLTRCWALDLAGDGVRVNAICPGVVRTGIFENFMPASEVEGFLAEFEKTIPLGRVGEADDIAQLALFLCSDAASWITGAVVPLDGGLSLGAVDD